MHKPSKPSLPLAKPLPRASPLIASDANHSILLTRGNGQYGFRLFRDATAGMVNFQIGNGPGSWESKIVMGEGEGPGSRLLLNPTGGNVGIGTQYPSEKLSVDGNIVARKLRITQSGWPDYVFATDYRLYPLQELETFIKTHKHLPEIPSAAEVEKNGLDVGENQAALLKKIEELTLYLIEQNKTIKTQQQDIGELKQRLKAVEGTVRK